MTVFHSGQLLLPWWRSEFSSPEYWQLKSVVELFITQHSKTRLPFELRELMTADFSAAKQPVRSTDNSDYSVAVVILTKDLFLRLVVTEDP